MRVISKTELNRSKTAEGLLHNIEGLVNDFESGLSSKEEVIEVVCDYIFASCIAGQKGISLCEALKDLAVTEDDLK